MSGLKVGAMFAGYGGLEMGLAQVLDVEPAWFAEFDPAPSAILAHRWPGVPNLGDVTAVDWSAVEPVDVITGGSPCQDLSHAGKRAGMTADSRSGLWWAMREAVRTIRPRLVLWENVRGALSAPADSAMVPCPGCVGDPGGDGRSVLRALGRVLGDLADLGYDAAWHGLRAADVGAPHGRWRVFVLAWPAEDPHGATGDQWWLAAPGQAEGGRALPDPGGSDRAPGERVREQLDPLVGRVSLLPTPEAADSTGGRISTDLGGYRDSGAKRAVTLATALHHLLPTPRATDGTKGGPNQHGSSGDLMLPSAVQLLPTPAVNDMGRAYTPEEWDEWTARMKAAHGNGNGHGASLHVEALRLPPTPRTENNENRQSEGYGGADGNFHGLLTGQSSWGTYAPAIARWEPIVGRPAPLPTAPRGRGGAQRLNPRFVEWMMGVPDGWVTDTPGITANQALKALGNGVVPQQAEAAVRALLDVRASAGEVAA